MPKDVTLGEGRMGEALLQAYPGQYRDAAHESSVYDTSSVHLAQPGRWSGQPTAVGDPDSPTNSLVEREVPGVGRVVVKVPQGQVVIPPPPALRHGPPVMRYEPQENMGPEVPYMRGITPYPQDMAGLGVTTEESHAMREYYFAMHDRGLEIAEAVKGIADEWLKMQTIKSESKDRITSMILAEIPGQDDEMVGTYLAPAIAKIDDLFLEPEDKLLDMAAMQGWIEMNMSSNVIPTMEKIRASVGLNYMDSPKARAIMASVGAATPSANYYAENWLRATFAAVSSYLAQVAPRLSSAKNDRARQGKMAGIIQNEINKAAPDMMARLGMTQDEIAQAMRQIGLGNPIAFLVVLAVVLAIGMTAAGAAAVYYHGVAKAAVSEGLAGVEKIDSEWRKEYQLMLARAKEGATKEELDNMAAQAGYRMTQVTNEVANNIRKAEPSGLGLGTSLVIGAAIAAGIFLVTRFL